MIRVLLALLAGALIATAAPIHGRSRHIRSFDCKLPKGRIPLPAAVATT